jgi:outer membrane protein TolC
MCVPLIAQESPFTLDDCIQIALKNNATILTNQNLNESSDKDVLASYSGILPSINVSASSGRFEAGEGDPDFRDVPVAVDSLGNPTRVERLLIPRPGFQENFNQFSLNIRQNLFNGGEWWNAIRYAQTQKRAADYNLISIINSTVSAVQERFFDLLKQQKLLEVNELAVKRSEDQLSKTEKMYELGAVAKVDVFRSRVNLGNDRTELLLQKNAVITARNNLNLSLGRNPNLPINIKPQLVLKPAFTNTEDLVETAIAKNPGLMKTEEDVKVSDLATARSYAVLYPNLSAFLNYQRSNEEIKRVYTSYDKNWTINYGLSISLNLFNGFQDMVNIQKSKLAERNNQVAYEESKRELVASVLQLVDNYNAYLEIIEINVENLEAANEEFRLAEERYRIGSGTQLEVREAQVNLTRAEQTLVAAQYNARITQSRLEQALGIIYAADEED